MGNRKMWNVWRTPDCEADEMLRLMSIRTIILTRFDPDCLSSVCGHLVNFANFPMLRGVSKTPLTIFIRFQLNFMESISIRGKQVLLLFC